MCTPLAHGLAGYAVLVLVEPKLSSDFKVNVKALAAGFFFGSLADADFLVAYYTKIPVLQHHFFTHSIPFTLVIGIFIYLFLKALQKVAPEMRHQNVMRLTLILTAAYTTHLLLDYFTHDGSPPIGIPLLWPFSHQHFVSPVEFFLSVHRGSMEGLFGAHNFRALFREMLILGPIALVCFIHAKSQRQSRKEV